MHVYFESAGLMFSLDGFNLRAGCTEDGKGCIHLLRVRSDFAGLPHIIPFVDQRAAQQAILSIGAAIMKGYPFVGIRVDGSIIPPDRLPNIPKTK